MRSCVLALTWLGAVLLLALQRGSAASSRAAPAAAAAAAGLQSDPALQASRPLGVPRLARAIGTGQDPGITSAQGARFARNRGQARPSEQLVLLDELEAVVDEQDKRQFDDYGHMRFGKRGPQQQQRLAFDDYGHMRFGRAGSD